MSEPWRPSNDPVACEQCFVVGKSSEIILFKGRYLCPKCLNPPLKELTMEEYLDSLVVDTKLVYGPDVEGLTFSMELRKSFHKKQQEMIEEMRVKYAKSRS